MSSRMPLARPGSIVVFLALAASCWWVLGAAEAQPTKRSTDSSVDVKRLEEKVDEIARRQDAILRQLEDVLEELRIVKVRCTG